MEEDQDRGKHKKRAREGSDVSYGQDAFISVLISILRMKYIPFSSMMTVEGTFVTTIYW